MEPPPLPPFIHPQPIPSSTRAHFSTAPWTLPLLSSPLHVPIPTPWAQTSPKTPSTFMSSTLFQNDTILAHQSFYKPAPSADPASFAELLTLYSLGPGTQNHIDLAHGGFLSALLDQGMGSVVKLDPECGDPLTASMEIRFRAPVGVPGCLVCRVWVVRREGRKVWVGGTLEVGGEGREGGDGEGEMKVAAEAKSLVIVGGIRKGKL
ncbi:MAG: hypothetical protein MMC23_006795 [Stictis urceolatum]|nr:hypothetical protein [Stictis urceolata]